MCDIQVSLVEFFTELAKYKKANPDMRHGQCLYNVLHSMNPRAANRIVGTDKDPFFASSNWDDRVSEFFSADFWSE